MNLFVKLGLVYSVTTTTTNSGWLLGAHAQELCLLEESDNTLCGGISVLSLSGDCTPLFAICNLVEDDSVVKSTCDTNRQRCWHEVPVGMPVCLGVDCEPNCEGKQCGEDDCGGFCGMCGVGEGCANFECVAGKASGSCASPYALGTGGDDEEEGNNGSIISTTRNDNNVTIIDTDTRITLITRGDTSQSIHIETPSCNTLTASPELIYTFTVPVGRTYGYDFQSFGYDTVLQLMKDDCLSQGLPGDTPGPNILNCNDDGTPPGDLGSHIFGEITEGTYYIMVDGYSTTDSGPFELITTFVNGCVPLCDGNFCGDDTCGGVCGLCGEDEECNVDTNRCYPANCQPACETRECGEDGCGGSCGTCDNDENSYCLGVSIFREDDSLMIPPSSCETFEVCNNFQPVCQDCTGPDQICASDCNCYDSLRDLADLTVLEEHMLSESFLQDVMIPESSCTLLEGCVPEPGLRRLFRFTSSVLNQGHTDLTFPEPKDRPDLFEFGACHQHYHFKSFATYTLYAEDGETVVISGQKYAYCMEDTARHFDGPNFVCDKQYDCGSQGISSGWLDSYGWSLDCSWVDVTDLEPGSYVLKIEANPSRVFPEVSFDNNIGKIRVEIPAAPVGEILIPLQLDTAMFVTETEIEEDNEGGDTGTDTGDNTDMVEPDEENKEGEDLGDTTKEEESSSDGGAKAMQAVMGMVAFMIGATVMN